MSMTKRSLPEFQPVEYPPDFDHEEYGARLDGEHASAVAMIDQLGEPAPASLCVMAEDSGRFAARDAVKDDGFDMTLLDYDLKQSWRHFADGIENVTSSERREAGAWFRVSFWLEVKRLQQRTLVVVRRGA